MALERLSLGSGQIDIGEEGGRQVAGDAAAAVVGDDGGKTGRLPRWTRQEILVLIQGKRVAESRVRRGRGASGSAFGSGQIEPKWASVSSYCKKHGVNRGPVQCRKRWSNLAGDYKKIKEWEAKSRDDTESFWVMRNDLRRERKLPGFFDREVYDILDGGGGEKVDVRGGLSLELAPPEGEHEAVFDCGRSAAATADDGMFSDFEEAGRSPDRNTDAPVQDVATPVGISGVNSEKQPESESEVREMKKRKRDNPDEQHETTNLPHQLIEALEKSGRVLRSQLESQNTHLQLDREQRNDHVDGLLTVLNKLADALGRIADKL